MWTDVAGQGDFRPVYHPAGFDAELRVAVEEVRAGRWMAMRDLLAHTGENWPLRTFRTQVLGVAAAGSDVVRVWREEEPHSVDALVMAGRVAVERALQARRQQHAGADRLEEEARDLCLLAARYAPQDPVPLVCLLALAQLDVELRRPEHRQRPPAHLLPPGPWGLLAEAQHRDPHAREAYHRMLQVLHARPVGAQAGALDYVYWVISWAAPGSALRVLPLYVHVESRRRELERGQDEPLGRRRWVREYIKRDTRRALYGWFYKAAPGSRSTVDLNYLAHALWAGNEFSEAAQVFRAIGPYATWLPWAHVADDSALAEDEFLKARAQSRAVGDSERARARP